ncbi:MAG: DUF86 domain-containing protein [Candidatus Nanoarchaeia archaeon]|nr:DUF86 domain-containing protein [Candidatus Nanoarchaeia archaeon]MDD5588270.1 DUF86 domain-containing protein [Candidatus Nanoarchaeia archaeon]
MNDRINEKIEEIEKYLNELMGIVPDDFEEYKLNLEKKAACERYFEKVVEAVVDLTFLVIKEKKLKIPEGDKEAFDILFKKGLILKDLAENLKEAKGMRNILAHEYGKVDDKLVFQSITKELEDDVKEFINLIERAL